ncbi:MAG: hypothetical protein WC455_28715 [Dehalococcoidia bacterium]|jgi:hypothetical protein
MNCLSMCPTCRSELTRDEVDIGVGTLRSPARCNNCGWSEEDTRSQSTKELLDNLTERKGDELHGDRR